MIKFQNITKSYDDFVAVDNFSLEIEKGEIIVLIGPSGCGKTTTLRMINRLLDPTEGKIYIDGQDISKIDVVKLRRNIGYVIQQIALFPHMTIADNVGLVPYLNKWPKDKRKNKIMELLEFVGMPAAQFYNRYPNELSGGQQQRIGVARALAADPEIILMDEPFGALDPLTRAMLQDDLLDMQDELQKTIVFVTHDMDEAIKLADKIVVMKDGEILQYASPGELLRNPAHGFVEEFIGKERLLQMPEYILVRDIMIKNPVTISLERTLTQAFEKMRRRKVDSLMVVNKSGKLLGLITSNSVIENFDKVEKVSEIVKTVQDYVKEDATVSQVLAIMANKKTGYVPVLNENHKLVGLITRSSLVNVLGQNSSYKVED